MLFVLSLTKCQCHMDYWCSNSLFIEQEGRKHTKNHTYYMQWFLGMYKHNILWTIRSIHGWCESYNTLRESTHIVTPFVNMTKYSMTNIVWSNYKHEQVVFLHISFLRWIFYANGFRPIILFIFWAPFGFIKITQQKCPPMGSHGSCDKEPT